MLYPWHLANHKTFIAHFPDKVLIEDVVDVVYGEILKHNPAADVRFSLEPFVDLCNIDVRVGDVEYKEVKPKFFEDLRFSFLHNPTAGRPERCSGNQSCEGKLTRASEAALLVALERFGGWLRLRRPGSMDKKDTDFKVTDYVHERSPFFKAISEVREFMPLYGACEAVKAAQHPERRQRLLNILGAVPLTAV